MFQCISFRRFDPKPVVLTFGGYTVRKRLSRDWEVFDAEGKLICITVYKRGSLEVVKRLLGLPCDEAVDTAKRADKRGSKISAASNSKVRADSTKAIPAKSIRQKRRAKRTGTH